MTSQASLAASDPSSFHGAAGKHALPARRTVALGLPTNWPGSLSARDFGDDVDFEDEDMEAFHTTLPTAAGAAKHIQESEAARATGAEGATTLQVAFAALGALILAHDLTILPFALAWQLDFQGYFAFAAVISITFWTLEMLVAMDPCALCVGDPVAAGAAQARRRRYLRTWFGLDLAMIVVDLVWITLEITLRSVAVDRYPRYKLIRLLRLADVLRALRIANRLKEVFERFEPRFASGTKGMLYLVVLAICTLWFTHVVACAWFAVGRLAPSDTEGSWLEVQFSVRGEPTSFREVGRMYQYVTALHWSLAQLCLGSIETPATNSSERVFNVTWLLVGLMFGSVLVSSLSAEMVEAQTRQRDRDQKLHALQQYLRRNSVDYRLGLRVIQQATERLRAEDAAEQATLPTLALLSKGLRMQLHGSVCRPALLANPLLRLLEQMDPAWFDRFCMEVVTFAFLREADELFSSGAPASCASVLLNGCLSYAQSSASAPVEEDVVEEVKPGAWLCESVLWCDWVHVGTATCKSPCKMLTLDAAKFAATCRGHRLVGAVALEYCREYHRRIATAQPPFAKWPTDLFVPGTDFGDVVSSMPRAMRVHIGAQAIRHCYANSRRWRRAAASEGRKRELLSEVRQGTCTVVMDGAGRLVRILSLIAVRLVNGEGQVFAQLGKRERSEVTAACELPGMKCREGELPADTMARILASKLSPLAACVELESMEQTVAEKTSGHHGVHTRYYRTVCAGRLVGTPALPVCGPLQDEEPPNTAGGGSPVLARRAGAALAALHSHSGEMGRAESTAMGTGTLPESVLQAQVFFIMHEGKGTYYAWLHEADLAVLADLVERRPWGGPALASWLGRLSLPADPERRRAAPAVTRMAPFSVEGKPGSH